MYHHGIKPTCNSNESSTKIIVTIETLAGIHKRWLNLVHILKRYIDKKNEISIK